MRKKFLKYAIPSVLSMWVYSLYTMVDGLFVANGVGEEALAAVNISMPFVNAVFALSIMFAVGTSTISAISLGNKEDNKASEIFTMNMTVLIVIGAAVAAAVLMKLENIAYFLGATENTIIYVKEYLGITAVFAIFPILSYYFEVLVKTDGKPRLSTICVCISAITNIVLDYIFVIELGYGVRGAAIATGIAQMVPVMVYISYFALKSSKIKFAVFKLEVSVLLRTMLIGMSDFINEFSSGFIIFIFNITILKNIGEMGIITYTIIMYINNIVTMTMTGISQGNQPLVSYYYGRGDKKTYLYFLRTAIKSAGVISLVIYAVCLIFAKNICGIFISSGETRLIEYSAKAIRWYSSAYLILGFNIVFSGFYAALERTLYSSVISVGRGFVVIVPCLFVMAHIFGEKGIWMSSFVAEAICLLTAISVFIRFYYVELFDDAMGKEMLGDYD